MSLHYIFMSKIYEISYILIMDKLKKSENSFFFKNHMLPPKSINYLYKMGTVALLFISEV